MGYTTDFRGKFECTPALTPAQVAYINKFADTRRMGRMEGMEKVPDPLREAVGLPIGVQGGYCTSDSPDYIIDGNIEPTGQPGLWCQWVSSEDGTSIYWDEGEKFYNYVQWLEYIIKHFFELWGVKLNGQVLWDGENSGDLGRLAVWNNEVTPVDAAIFLLG